MLPGLGLIFKARRLVYHSTLGLRVIKKKKLGGHLDEFVDEEHEEEDAEEQEHVLHRRLLARAHLAC